MNKQHEYFLFIDESGTFKETSTDAVEFNSRKKTRSQIVGFLAQRQPDILSKAERILDEIYREAGVIEKKGSELNYSELNEIIPRLIKKLKAMQWQPVRLVNEEKVTFGSRISVYTNMVAELLLRIFQCKAESPQDKILIYLVGSEVQLEKMDRSDARINQPQTPKRRIIELESYKQRIEEAIGFSAVHRGITRNQINWELYDISLEDARTEPELKICDLLSNASKDKYDKSSNSNKQLLIQAFGIFDQTMQTKDILERIDQLVNENALSSALIELARTLTSDTETDYFKTAAQNRLNSVLNKLSLIGARGRDAHFAVLIAWLDQLIGQERLADVGYKIANWILKNVLDSLYLKLQPLNQEGTLDWIKFSINRWLLTAANHRGALRQARKASNAINQLSLQLALQSEHLPLLLDGFIVQAVHQTDCFEYKQAIENLEQIAELARQQSENLSKLLQIPSGEIRSDMHAKTLGTLTVGLILAGFEDESKINYARRRSDEAIDRFSRQQDKERQYQYRCHLETLAGDFDAARLYLMKSLRPLKDNETSVNHKDLFQEISSLEKEKHFKYYFTLAHWLRIGATAARQNTDNQKAEFDNFYPVFVKSLVVKMYQNKNFNKDFPAHLILKNIAFIESAHGESQTALKILQSLNEITLLNDNHLILPIIQIASYAETAANIWKTGEGFALVDSSKIESKTENQPKNDINLILNKMFRQGLDEFPNIKAKLQNWQEQISKLKFEPEEAENSRRVLLDIAKEIRY